MSTPTRVEMAEFARKALDAYSDETGSDEETRIKDLLSDLHHYCDLNSIDWEGTLHSADIYYREEVREEKLNNESDAN